MKLEIMNAIVKGDPPVIEVFELGRVFTRL